MISPMSSFCFFDLSLELRELVYDYIKSGSGEVTLWNSEDEDFDEEAYLDIKDYPRLNVLLVNRQFKQEYEKRSAGRTTLIFSEHEKCSMDLPPIPAGLLGVKRIEVRAFIECSYKRSELTDEWRTQWFRQLSEFINKILLELPRVESIELHLGLLCPDEPNYVWPKMPQDTALVGLLQELVNMPQMTRLSIYSYLKSYLGCGHDYEYDYDEPYSDATELADGRKPLADWLKGRDWRGLAT